jgi:hypothetical protein
VNHRAYNDAMPNAKAEQLFQQLQLLLSDLWHVYLDAKEAGRKEAIEEIFQALRDKSPERSPLSFDELSSFRKSPNPLTPPVSTRNGRIRPGRITDTIMGVLSDFGPIGLEEDMLTHFTLEILKGEAKPNSVYVAIKRMKDNGFITSRDNKLILSALDENPSLPMHQPLPTSTSG